MFPHPPTSAKLNISRQNIRSSSKKFPGLGKSINESERLASSKQHRNTLVKPLSPVKQISMKTRSSGKEKSRKKEDVPSTATNSQARPTRNPEKRDSFSRYTPLPAIGSQDEKERKTKICQPKTSGKRSLPKSAEKHFPERSNTPSDEGLSDTIKRMRLGLDFGSSTSQDQKKLENNSDQSEITNKQVVSNLMEHAEKDNTEINLMLRLPDGSRVQTKFKQTDLLQSVLQFLSKQMKISISLTRYVLYLNEVPKRELKNVKSTLSKLSIKDRSLLTLDTRD